MLVSSFMRVLKFCDNFARTSAILVLNLAIHSDKIDLNDCVNRFYVFKTKRGATALVTLVRKTIG
jgi:hypothetical protein